MEEFSIDAFVAEELLLPTLRPRMERFENFMYLVLHFPALRHSHQKQEQEIDFVIGKQFIITTRYEIVDPLHKFSKVFEVNSTLDKSNIGDHAGYVFYYMLKKLYKSIEHEIEYIRDALEDIEEEIFEGREKEMVAALSHSGRELLNIRQAIEPHRDVLKSLDTESTQFFGEEFTPYMRSMLNEYYRVHNHMMRNTQSLHELRETNNSLLYTKQNEVMKVLTIVAFITFPLTLITGAFSMNTVHNPVVGHAYDFWIVLLFMAAAAALMFGYFKYKQWL